MVKTGMGKLSRFSIGLLIGLTAVCATAGPDVQAWSRARWNASLISAPPATGAATLGLDHAASKYGDAWDFDEDDREGIDEFGSGLTDVTVTQGALRFLTGQNDNYFFWGDYRRDTPAYGAEKIDPAPDTVSGQGPRHLQMRLKQSLPSSTWTFSTAADDTELRKRFRIRGTDWQTIDLALPADKTFWAVRLETEEPGNNVAIDWIRLEAELPAWYYRTTFELMQDPQSSSFVVLCSPKYSFYVNGRCVKSQGNVSMRMYEPVACSEALVRGRNCIAVKVEGVPSYSARAAGLLAVEGIVHLVSGGYQRVFTDGSWRAATSGPDGWATAGFDDSQWAQAVAVERMAESSYGCLDNDPSWGFFVGPPYMGPIDIRPVGGNAPIFDSGRVDLNIVVSAPPVVEGIETRLDCVAYDAVSGDKVYDGTLRRPEEAGARNVYAFRHSLGHGPRYLYVTAKRGTKEAFKEGTAEVLDERWYELVVTGSVRQRKVGGTSFEEGLDLELVDKIDCTEPFERHAFCDGPFLTRDTLAKLGTTAEERKNRLGSHGQSAVVETPAGKCRITGNRLYDWFGYAFRVKHPGRPHVVAVDCPDDAYRCGTILVLEKYGREGLSNDASGRLGQPRTGGAMYTGGPYPTTGRMLPFRQIFWPMSEEGFVVVCKGQSPFPAAAARIAIYEIDGELPMLAALRSTDRLFGFHGTGADTVALACYSGPRGLKFVKNLLRSPYLGFYTDWYITIENMIRQMRFVGCNLYVADLCEGTRMHYPSASAALVDWPDRLFVPRADPWELMAKMFAANDLKLVLNVDFTATPAMVAREPYSDYEVQAMGALTLKQVGATGRQTQAADSGFNVFHPVFEGEFMALIDELCGLYGHCPGIAGIGQMWGDGSGFQVGADPSDSVEYLHWGYGDATMAAFTADTGIAVPVPDKDATRFEKRYRWLLSRQREKWTQWRNDRIKRLHLAVRDRVRKANGDWRYFIFGARLPYAAWGGYLAGKTSVQQVLRSAGLDPAGYKQEKGIVLSGMLAADQAEMQTDPDRFWGLRTVYADEETFRLYDNETETGVYPAVVPYKTVTAVAGDWGLERFYGVGYPFPAGTAALDHFGLALARSTPLIVPIGPADWMLPSGHAQALRETAAALHAIEPGVYQTLRGEGLDKNLVVRLCKTGRSTEFYVVNRLWGDVHVSLAIQGAPAVHDLVVGRRLGVESGRLEFMLAPFQTRVFSTSRGAELTAAGVHAPGVAAEVFERMADGRLVAERVDAGGFKNLDAATRSLIGTFQERYKEIAAAFETENLSRTCELLEDQRYRAALEQLRDRFFAQQWLVLGPFDNKDGKQLEADAQVEQDILQHRWRGAYPGAGGRAVAWRAATARVRRGATGYLDFDSLLGAPDWAVGYAYTRIFSNRRQRVRLSIGSDDGIRVWINGKLVHSKDVTRRVVPGQDRASVLFRDGWNEVLVKAADRTEAWETFFDVFADSGARIWDLEYNPRVRPTATKLRRE
ncbi:MAG: hypothetical protein JXR37_19925 [Kiritimatiellae bacterium]|nr:hypothetical protein [Kiritimatiellia bacterium]